MIVEPRDCRPRAKAPTATAAMIPQVGASGKRGSARL